MNDTRWFTAKGWAFVPGPRDQTSPISSLDLQELAEHSPLEIATTILSFPGMELAHANEPGWYDWRAWWLNGEESLELTMSLMGSSDEFWGGSEIIAHCHPESLLALWTHLNTHHAGIWLHDPDCRMHPQASFRTTMRPD